MQKIVTFLIEKSQEKGIEIKIIKEEIEENQALLTINYFQKGKSIFYKKEIKKRVKHIKCVRPSNP